MEKYTFIVEKKIPGALGCYKNKKAFNKCKAVVHFKMY